MPESFPGGAEQIVMRAKAGAAYSDEFCVVLHLRLHLHLHLRLLQR